jgi:hypothetical protein
LCSLPAQAVAAAPSPAEIDFFEKDVRPLLVEKCLQCHGEVRPKGGLRLTSRANILKGGDRGPAVVAGKPEESLLLRAVRHLEQPRMPPKEKLTGRQIEVLSRWVKLGLPWPATQATLTANEHFTITEKQKRFWAFQPVKAVAIPTVRDQTWPRSTVDRFILSALEAKGLTPAAPAYKRTLLRRVTFDLIGLPPTSAEINRFLADDSPDAFARVLDRLLASPQYGERLGRYWLDLVRYADARDLIQLPEASDFREAWRYRDWVVDAINQDMPYSDFMEYQVAGDLLQPRDPERINKDALVATGLLAIADFVPGDVDKELMIADYVNDQIDVVSRAFLGLTVACARCHDHKFDPISTEDYYGLAGIFFSTRLIPGPVAGNTPLVRVPLLPQPAIDRAKAKFEADKRRLGKVQRALGGAADREYRAVLRRLATTQTARYLVAACEHRHRVPDKPIVSLNDLARERKLDVDLLKAWLTYLGKDRPTGRTTLLDAWRKKVREPAAGKLDRTALERSARELEQSLARVAARREIEAKRSPGKKTLAESLLLHFRADDPARE